MNRYRFLAVAGVVLLAVFAPSRADLPLGTIRMPDGFHISLFAPEVPGARSLTWGERGTLFVGTRREGKVYAILDKDGDHRADDVKEIARGLRMPNGVAFRDGALYVAEIHRVLRYDRIEERLEAPPEPAVLSRSFPSDTHHGWKFIAFGPDGLLYVPVGAPCNACEPDEEIYASITRMRHDGTGFEIFAKGIRNTVGFDWHPETKALWFTDNGRDHLGDDLPPDELNTAPRKGMHFGYPYCHGAEVRDPELGAKRSCDTTTPPAQELGPHVASLGMRFYTGKMFPDEYRGSILIAEHGSWNRSTRIGYRVTRVRLEGGRSVGYETFASGWLQGEEVWGRPVDLLLMPDGSLLVSDDHAGAIYRITYAPEDPAKPATPETDAPEPKRP